VNSFYGGGGVESRHAKAGKRWIELEAQRGKSRVEGTGNARPRMREGCKSLPRHSSDSPVNAPHSRSSALPASTLFDPPTPDDTRDWDGRQLTYAELSRGW